MITTAIRLKNIAFLVISVLVLGFLGVRYADLGHYVGLRDYYTVTVQLPQTGGLFTHSNVTYRGVSVGRVGPIELTDEGVEAELRIENDSPPIPDSLTAVVANLSAVGEQYIDLRPTRSTGPFLGNGSVVDQADTTIPAPPTDVLVSVNDLASSVDLESLRTVVDEFGTALVEPGRRPPGPAGHRQRVRRRRRQGPPRQHQADAGRRDGAAHPGRTGRGAQRIRGRGEGPGRRAEGVRQRPAAG